MLRSEPLIAVLPEHHPLADLDAVPLGRLKEEPFVTYPSHFRSVLHDAVEEACAAHGFKPLAAHEVAETATLVSFVAAGLGVSLVPASVRHMTVQGAIYRPLAGDSTRRTRRRLETRRRSPSAHTRARRNPPRSPTHLSESRAASADVQPDARPMAAIVIRSAPPARSSPASAVGHRRCSCSRRFSRIR
jgi:DNA-binding transcriptional LysR family regulator